MRQVVQLLSGQMQGMERGGQKAPTVQCFNVLDCVCEDTSVWNVSLWSDLGTPCGFRQDVCKAGMEAVCCFWHQLPVGQPARQDT